MDLNDSVLAYIDECSACSLKYNHENKLQLSIGSLEIVYRKDMNPAEIIDDMEELYKIYSESLYLSINKALCDFVHLSKTTFN